VYVSTIYIALATHIVANVLPQKEGTFIFSSQEWVLQ